MSRTMRCLGYLAVHTCVSMLLFLVVLGLTRGGAADQQACPSDSGLTPTQCIGDANGDCTVDIGDAVYLLAYLFSSGPAPAANALELPFDDLYVNEGQVDAITGDMIADQSVPAAKISFLPTSASLTATDVQGALAMLDSRVIALESTLSTVQGDLAAAQADLSVGLDVLDAVGEEVEALAQGVVRLNQAGSGLQVLYADTNQTSVGSNTTAMFAGKTYAVPPSAKQVLIVAHAKYVGGCGSNCNPGGGTVRLRRNGAIVSQRGFGTASAGGTSSSQSFALGGAVISYFDDTSDFSVEDVVYELEGSTGQFELQATSFVVFGTTGPYTEITEDEIGNAASLTGSLSGVTSEVSATGSRVTAATLVEPDASGVLQSVEIVAYCENPATGPCGFDYQEYAVEVWDSVANYQASPAQPDHAVTFAAPTNPDANVQVGTYVDGSAQVFPKFVFAFNLGSAQIPVLTGQQLVVSVVARQFASPDPDGLRISLSSGTTLPLDDYLYLGTGTPSSLASLTFSPPYLATRVIVLAN